MTRTLTITATETKESSLYQALQREETLCTEAVQYSSPELFKSVSSFAPEIILLELLVVDPESISSIRSILEVQPVPIIVVCPKPHEVEELIKEAGAVAALSSNEEERSRILRHIRIMKGLKIVRPRATRPSQRTGAKYLLVGASSGGPSVIKGLLSGLQPTCGLSVVLAQHLSADNQPTFRDWLSKEIPWNLEVCDEPKAALPGSVYLAKGDCHIVWTQGRLCSLPKETPLEFVPSANRLFHSFVPAAQDVIALVLSGMGDDGTEGLVRLRASGALTLAQQPEDAKVSGMPASAVASGAVQHTVPGNQVASVILSFLGEQASREG